MPFKSLAQERWAHTPNGTSALGGPGKIKEWDSATKGKSLPERKGMAKTMHDTHREDCKCATCSKK